MGEQATGALLEILGKTVQHLELTSDPDDMTKLTEELERPINERVMVVRI